MSILTQEQISQCCELLGIDVDHCVRVIRSAKYNSLPKKVQALIVPAPTFWIEGVPVKFGDVEKPTAEVA